MIYSYMEQYYAHWRSLSEYLLLVGIEVLCSLFALGGYIFLDALMIDECC